MDFTVVLITFFISFLLASFVFWKNKHSATNIFLTLLIVCNGVYPIFNYLVLQSADSAQTLFWTKIVMLFAIPVGPLLYFFVNVFPNSKFLFNKLLQTIIIFWIIINIILLYMGLIFQSAIIQHGNLQLTPGPAIVSFGLLQVMTIIAGSIQLGRRYRKATGLLKLQLRYITVGIIVGFGLTFISTIVLPIIFKNTLLIPVSPLFLLIAVVAITYSVIRHRLLDIRFIVARSVAYSLLVLVMGGAYASALFIVGTLIFKQQESINSLVISAIFAIIIVFSFQPIKALFEKYTDKVFFRNQYEPEMLLGTLSKVMSKTIILSELSDLVLKEILGQLKISFGNLVLVGDGTMEWVNGKNEMDQIAADDEKVLLGLVRDLVNTPGENVLVSDEQDDASQEKEFMRKYNIEILLPLVVENKVVGTIILGNKSSGDIYSSQDIDILKILAPEVAVAVRNALSYEEIKRFNITLKEEVDKATEDLQKANEHLKQLDKLKDEFVSLASHELRTPMTIIKSYLWMVLQDKKAKLTDQQKLYLERAFTASDGLINLVNDMLNVSRIESGRFSIEKQDIDITDLVKTTVTELTPEAEKRGLKLEFNLRNSVPKTISIDPERIKQILINLIGNSMKFTHDTGRIEVSLSSENNMVVVRVADNGVGISKENMAKLFQKFGLLRESYEKSDVQGTGLGLYISKSIVELHSGRIWAESEGEGKGTVFTFTLPESVPDLGKAQVPGASSITS